MKRTAGVKAVQAATTKLGIDLAPLVAEVAIWAHPDAHLRLVSDSNPTGARYPLVRRARLGSGETPGEFVDGVRLDRNNYAGTAIRDAVPFEKEQLSGYHACHVWPETCYDERYHTVLANLALVPAPLAGLTDFDPGVIRAMQYRSFELFGWRPAEVPTPSRPKGYPTNWMHPEARPQAIKRNARPTRQRTQRDVMRQAWKESAGKEALAVELWIRAVRNGEVIRRSNTRGMSEEEYGKRLLYDGLTKGWLLSM